MTAQRDWLGDLVDDMADEVEYEPVHVPDDGPHDIEDLDPEVTLAAGIVDFGAVHVPVPDRGTVVADPAEQGRMQAVHISVPEGRLSVSALAAPRSSRLWPDLAKEIDASLRAGGARVRSFQGDWGRELHATSGGATSLFVGVDRARWMLYGVATGPIGEAAALEAQLRRMIRGTVVVRGRSPYPVRTVLPLEVPEHLLGAAPALAPAAAPPTAAAPVADPAGQPVLDERPDPDDRPTDIWPAALVGPAVRETPPMKRWSAVGAPASAASGRRRGDLGPAAAAPALPEVLRAGRHAAAPVQRWAFEAAHGGSEPITEPLPAVPRPAARRPGGRHRKPD